MYLKKSTCLASLLFLALLSPGVRADALTDQAKGMLDAGKSAQAFALLDAQESTRAGEVMFDFLLGLAAIDVGQNRRIGG